MTERCTLIANALGQRPDAPMIQELIGRYRTLKELADATPEELTAIAGIGNRRAHQLQAIFQLGRRWLIEGASDVVTIQCPSDAAALLLPRLSHLDREVFKVMLLNIRNHVLAIETVSIGTINTTPAHPREVFKPALRRSAAFILLAHNHPSGCTEPSPEDIALTRRLMKAGELLGIEVLDHLIIGNGRWVSLKELGHV